jgi:hypothetical protein
VFFTPKRRPTARRLLGNRARGERARREYATTLYVTGAIQVALSLALLVAGAIAFQAVQAHARDVETTLRLGLPALFIAAAAVTARSAIHNLRLAKTEGAPRTDSNEAEE